MVHVKLEEIKYVDLDPQLFDGYMCEEDDGIIISQIISKRKGEGNFKRLVNELKQKYRFIKIPTPSNQMREIALHLGFTQKLHYFEEFEEMGEIMYWEKNAKRNQ